jgi:hypothetical protein
MSIISVGNQPAISRQRPAIFRLSGAIQRAGCRMHSAVRTGYVPGRSRFHPKIY